VTFLTPIALWGAVALLVPLLLHLRRRRVGRTIQVGSLKHLDTLPTAERRGPRVRDPWRLLLRATIVGLLTVLLAEPVLIRPAGEHTPLVIADSRLSADAIDSLRALGEVRVERLDDPWRRVQELDDSLPAGIPLIVAATSRSSAYHGPRPSVGRPITWRPYPIAAAQPESSIPPGPSDLAPRERAALSAALGAVVESFGPLGDTAGWMKRLPVWWHDSLDVPAFPIAVAHAVAPTKSLPAPVAVTASQLLPREVTQSGRRTESTELHWWLWGILALLFLLERLWARSLQEAV
jgi:hypothetical protein